MDSPTLLVQNGSLKAGFDAEFDVPAEVEVGPADPTESALEEWSEPLTLVAPPALKVGVEGGAFVIEKQLALMSANFG